MKADIRRILSALGGVACVIALAGCATSPKAGGPITDRAKPEPGMDDSQAPWKKAMPPEPEAEAPGVTTRGESPPPPPPAPRQSAPSGGAASAPVDPKRAEAPFLTQRVFYGTNRMTGNTSDPNSYYSGGLTERLEVGTCDVSIPVVHQAGKLEAPDPLSWQYWLAGEFQENPKKHVVLLGVNPLERSAFLRELQGKLGNGPLGRKRCFVFVHGFNVPFRNAARRTAQMAHDLGFPGAPIFFSWPSQGGEAFYLADSDNNLRSRPELRDFLELIARDTGAQEIYVIAHSMGNRVASDALPDAYGALGPFTRPKLKAMILAAPDIDANVFNNQIVPRFADTGIPLTLYASRSDRALQVARQVTGTARVGQDPLLAVGRGVDVIDASAVETDFTEHSYFGNAPALLREFKAIFDGKKPAQRSWLRAETAPSGARYWVLPSGS